MALPSKDIVPYIPPKVAPWRSKALKLRPGRCIVKYVNHQDGGGSINLRGSLKLHF
jgi:hypothetical protein